MMELLPHDAADRILTERTHPPGWTNPKPARRYNLVVVGGGTAGLVSAAGAALAGARVALVEKDLLGGDCLVTGCVPSKSIIRSARAAAAAGKSGEYGIKTPDGVTVDFMSVMTRMRRLRAEISRHDSAVRMRDEFGVDVFLGQARFTGTRSVEVEGAVLDFKRAIICTGSRPAIPGIPGLSEAGFLTSENLFNLTALPGRLAIIGAGPAGAEMAQAFSRLGSEVILLDVTDRILPRDEEDAAALVQEALVASGVDLLLGSGIDRIERSGDAKRIHYTHMGSRETIETDEILVATGRRPHVEDLDLEAARVHYDNVDGVKVDDRLATSNYRIYAAGDVCLPARFTHAAEASARIAIINALFRGRKKLYEERLPWCTFTDPELAHVGLRAADAEAAGIRFKTITVDLSEVDRAIVDGDTQGMIQIHARKNSGKILGATIVAARAGEMINEISVAMAGGVGLKELSGVIHPYPTLADAIKLAADRFQVQRITPLLERVSRGRFLLSRRIRP